MHQNLAHSVKCFIHDPIWCENCDRYLYIVDFNLVNRLEKKEQFPEGCKCWFWIVLSKLWMKLWTISYSFKSHTTLAQGTINTVKRGRWQFGAYLYGRWVQTTIFLHSGMTPYIIFETKTIVAKCLCWSMIYSYTAILYYFVYLWVTAN